ncbi:MAG: sugar ABC transporter substrate-binding protein [Cyanobacteria bacterium]|nr:sugar ABC transporter substrate-binding protein [Cyanobacteriota bacterium]
MGMGRGGRLAIAGLLLLAIAVGGCGNGGRGGEGWGLRSDRGGAIELEFWTMQLQPKFTPYFERLIGEFEQQNPSVAVRWIDVPWAAMERKMLTAVLGGTAPDVANLNPNFAARLAARGAWLNLAAVVPEATRSRYLDKIWRASDLEGETFAVPWYLTTRVTIYNQGILAAAGLTAPPATYGELAIAARTIRERTGKYAIFATFVPGDSAEVLESMVQMGMVLVDDRGRAAFNTPAGRAAFAYWVDLYKEGLLPPEVLTQGHRRAIELYQAGELALVASSPEFINAIATNAPTVAAQSQAAPQIVGETGQRSVAVMNLTVPKGTDHPEAAVKFALFVTNNDNQLAFAREANVLPSTGAALAELSAELGRSRAAGQGVEATLLRSRQIAAEQLTEARPLLPPIRGIQNLQKILYENLQAAMLGEKTIDQALADAEADWNER